MTASTETAPTEIYRNRLDRLMRSMEASNLDAIMLNPGPSMPYVSGLHFHMSERPVVLCISRADGPVIILPELESGKLTAPPFDMASYTYTEDLDSWPVAFQKGLSGIPAGATIGIEPRSLRVLELRLIEGGLRDASLVSAEQSIAELRMIKDEAEIECMTEAVHIAEQALRDTLPSVREGVSEKEMNNLLVQNMLKLGSQPELPFQPIVAFGPNSANPHAVSSDYTARKGDLLLFDWGANFEGYFSDLTRTLCLGEPDDELRRIYQTVKAANAAGCSHAAPGVTAGSVDDATRTVIDEAGYGEYFMHRTGHGLGLEVHEDPYIREDNDEILRPGMTFTVEPGIYLTGRGGVRIEDDVLVTEEGARSLSTISRDLKVLPA